MGLSGSDSQLDQTREGLSAPGAPEPSGGSADRGQSVARYIIIERLGAGGMGEVFSAYDPELDRRVALKLLRVGRGGNRERAQARLLREAQALAKLSHPNVVAVYDAGTHEKRVFIAMEYIEGETLRDWTKKDRGWREVLEVMVKAGRGLSAAHRVGLVHRDFKPGNVMVGPTPDRVRVLDFGLARRFGDSLEPRESGDELISGESSADSFSGTLTETGMVVGTPAYMAPEQFDDRSIDARTDQFAFCVVAWRALFEQVPFAGATYRELSSAVHAGDLVAPPREARVPRAIRLTLERGLAPDPGRRFPDMDALLEELQRALRAGRRRRVIVAAAAVGLAVVVGAGVLAFRADTTCRGLDGALRGVWDVDRRKAIADAFSATALANAGATHERVEKRLDAYAARWVELRTESCEATRVRGDQSEALMDLRTACLDSRLREFQALTDVFVSMDASVVENAVNAVNNLRSLEPCSDTERLLSDVPLPTDPAVAAEVKALRDQLTRARTVGLTGHYAEGTQEAHAVMARARELGYKPLIAEAGATYGTLLERSGKPQEAVETYDTGLWAAIASGHAYAEAEVLLGLGSVTGNHIGKPELALRHLRQAEAVLEHLDNPPELVGKMHLYVGTALLRLRRFDEAEESYRRAVELSGDRPDSERTKLAALSNLAAARGERGLYREALAANEEAVKLAEDALGPLHPLVGNLYNNLGATYSRIGDVDKAVKTLGRALEVYAAVIGPGHPEVARAHHNMGVALATKGDDAGAFESYRKALAIKRAALGPDDPSVAHSSNNCGDVLVRLGRAEEALTYIEDALRIWVDLHGRMSPDASYGLVSMAEAKLALSDPEAAKTAIDDAIEVAESTGLDPIQLARARWVAAQVYGALGREAEALDLAHKARAGYDSPERDSSHEIAAIDAWLAARPAGGR